jgi:hypothetical protein
MELSKPAASLAAIPAGRGKSMDGENRQAFAALSVAGYRLLRWETFQEDMR